jgi:hypothetical protein
VAVAANPLVSIYFFEHSTPHFLAEFISVFACSELTGRGADKGTDEFFHDVEHVLAF